MTPAEPPFAARPWLPALCFTLYGVLVVALAADATWRGQWDSATYLLTARSMAAGEGYVYAGEPFFLRPPGFSWLLIPFLGEGAPPNLGAVHAMLAVFAALAMAAFWFALLPRGRTFALAVALLSATTPLVVAQLGWVLSEFPFLATLFAAVALLERSFRTERRWVALALGGAALLAASYWIRSVTLIVLPAVVLVPALFHEGRRRRGLLPAALFLALAAPWMAYSAKAAEEATTPPDQLLLHDYRTALLHVDPGRPDSPLAGWQVLRLRMLENVPEVAADVAASVLHTDALWARWLLGLVVLAGWILALARGPGLLEWFALAYAGLLALYFDNDARLSVPLVPLVVLYAAHALRAAALAIPRVTVRRGALAAAFLAAFGANAVAFPRHADLESHPALSPGGGVVAGVTRGELWGRIRAMARWIRENTPEDAVVLCHSAPVQQWLTGRRCYTYRFPRGRDLFEKYDPDLVLWDGPPPPSLPARALRRTVRQDMIVVGDWRTPVFWLR